MKTTMISIYTSDILLIDGIKYTVEKSTENKRGPGRPKSGMAKFNLLLRRLNGKKLYRSFLYNDGNICTPF